MKYQIIAFNKDAGQIVVEYEDQWTFSLDLPVVDGLFPVGAELESLIQQYAPVWLVERQRALAAGVSNVADIEALVVPKVAPPVVMPEETIAQMPTTIING